MAGVERVVFAPKPIPRFEMCEGGIAPAKVVVRLGQRELDMEPVVVPEV
jgi:hypothetical protein